MLFGTGRGKQGAAGENLRLHDGKDDLKMGCGALWTVRSDGRLATVLMTREGKGLVRGADISTLCRP